MKQVKINIDRPKMSSNDIKKQMNFNDILSNHKIINKPFYHTYWFYGVTGLATISLFASALYYDDLVSFDRENNKKSLFSSIKKTTELKIETPKKDKTIINLKTKKLIEQTSTLKQTDKTNTKASNLISPEINEKEVLKTDQAKTNEIASVNQDLTEKKTFDFFDLHPRIGGKVNGEITKEELFDDQGLITYADVKIIHFELHLTDATEDKIFVENGNQLNIDMKKAIENINIGEEIYFENIKGLSTKGQEVKLTPLRYTLLN